MGGGPKDVTSRVDVDWCNIFRSLFGEFNTLVDRKHPENYTTRQFKKKAEDLHTYLTSNLYRWD